MSNPMFHIFDMVGLFLKWFERNSLAFLGFFVSFICWYLPYAIAAADYIMGPRQVIPFMPVWEKWTVPLIAMFISANLIFWSASRRKEGEYNRRKSESHVFYGLFVGALVQSLLLLSATIYNWLTIPL